MFIQLFYEENDTENVQSGETVSKCSYNYFMRTNSL